MKLTRRGTPRAALSLLKDGQVQRNTVIAKMRVYAGDDHTAAVALRRMEVAGWIVCEYRLTEEGAKVLEACQCKK